MKAVLIEDNVQAQELIRKLIAKYFPQLDFCGMASTVVDGEKLILDCRPQIMLVDIQLRDGSVFDLLDRLPAHVLTHASLIFITAFGTFENVYRAMRLSAIDYLVKPIDKDQFRKAVQDAIDRTGKTSLNKQIDILLDALKNNTDRPSDLNRISAFLAGGVIEYIPVQQILYIEADQTVSCFHLTGGKRVVSRRNLGHYDYILSDTRKFRKISRSLIINTEHLIRYRPAERLVELAEGHTVYASKRMSPELAEYLRKKENG